MSSRRDIVDYCIKMVYTYINDYDEQPKDMFKCAKYVVKNAGLAGLISEEEDTQLILETVLNVLKVSGEVWE